MVIIKEKLEKHLGRELTEDEKVILNTAYSYGKKEAFKMLSDYMSKNQDEM